METRKQSRLRRRAPEGQFRVVVWKPGSDDIYLGNFDTFEEALERVQNQQLIKGEIIKIYDDSGMCLWPGLQSTQP